MITRRGKQGQELGVLELPLDSDKEAIVPTPEERRRMELRSIREAQRIEKLKAAIARDFVEARGRFNQLARANDDLLRLVLRLPPSIRRSPSAMDAFYRDLGQRIGYESQQRGLIGIEQHAREETFKLRPSIEQLASYAEAEHRRNPNVILATSPLLDIDFSVDLIVGEPTWDQESMLLRLTIKLVQAKAGILNRERVRDKLKELVEKYHSSAKLLLSNFEVDPEWFRRYINRLQEAAALERIVFSVDEALGFLLGEATPLQLGEKGSPLELFSIQEAAVRAINDLAKDFEVPEKEKPLPQIILGSMSFVFLVVIETEKGLRVFKELTLEEALRY